MQVGNISFCDKVGFNINSDDVKKTILGDLEQSYGIRIIAKHYEKFDQERSLPNLNRNPHMICLRSNGNPYFLHLVKYNFTQYCIFVDKKIQQGYCYPRMILGRFSFADSLFENGGTLLEGEMIRTAEGRWYFVILDMLVMAGKHLVDVNLPKRINLIHSMLRDKHTPDPYSDVCEFRVKKYFTYGDYSNIEKHIASLPYTTRGLVFRPLYLKFKDVLLNFDDSLIVKVVRKKVGEFVETRQHKLVEPAPAAALAPQQQPMQRSTPGHDTNSRMMLAQKTNAPDVYNLYDQHTNALVGTAGIQGLVISKKMRALFTDKNVVDKIPISCDWNERFNKWCPCL
jgi:hypothetical protein